MNAAEIEQAVSEPAEQHSDREEFPFQSLAAYGNKYVTQKRLRTGGSNKSDVSGVLQIDNIHIATCAPGRTHATLAGLRASAVSARQKARSTLRLTGDR